MSFLIEGRPECAQVPSAFQGGSLASIEGGVSAAGCAARDSPREWPNFPTHFFEASVTRLSDSDPVTGARALVIEDEFLIAIDVQRILEAAGAREVILAARVADALKALGGPEPFDIAVLDILLGDESSEPVARILVERRIPFVYGTGMGIRDMLPKGLGHVRIVPKPYNGETLLKGLAQAAADLRQ
jgi:CheY-like chemotaxis protein